MEDCMFVAKYFEVRLNANYLCNLDNLDAQIPLNAPIARTVCKMWSLESLLDRYVKQSKDSV